MGYSRCEVVELIGFHCKKTLQSFIKLKKLIEIQTTFLKKYPVAKINNTQKDNLRVRHYSDLVS